MVRRFPISIWSNGISNHSAARVRMMGACSWMLGGGTGFVVSSSQAGMPLKGVKW